MIKNDENFLVHFPLSVKKSRNFKQLNKYSRRRAKNLIIRFTKKNNLCISINRKSVFQKSKIF